MKENLTPAGRLYVLVGEQGFKKNLVSGMARKKFIPANCKFPAGPSCHICKYQDYASEILFRSYNFDILFLNLSKSNFLPKFGPVIINYFL